MGGFVDFDFTHYSERYYILRHLFNLMEKWIWISFGQYIRLQDNYILSVSFLNHSDDL